MYTVNQSLFSCAFSPFYTIDTNKSSNLRKQLNLKKIYSAFYDNSKHIAETNTSSISPGWMYLLLFEYVQGWEGELCHRTSIICSSNFDTLATFSFIFVTYQFYRNKHQVIFKYSIQSTIYKTRFAFVSRNVALCCVMTKRNTNLNIRINCRVEPVNDLIRRKH